MKIRELIIAVIWGAVGTAIVAVGIFAHFWANSGYRISRMANVWNEMSIYIDLSPILFIAFALTMFFGRKKDRTRNDRES